MGGLSSPRGVPPNVRTPTAVGVLESGGGSSVPEEQRGGIWRGLYPLYAPAPKLPFERLPYAASPPNVETRTSLGYAGVWYREATTMMRRARAPHWQLRDAGGR